MRNIIDKSIIFIFSLAFYIPNVNNIYMIIPILVTIILSACLSYFDNDKFTIVVFVSYIFISFFLPLLIFFIPLITYDIVLNKIKILWLLSFLPLIIEEHWVIFAVILLVIIIKYRTTRLQKIEHDYYILRDDTREIAIQLEKQNHELMEKQDYEINLATVTERNRIARDIHDNVGHLLSRSILQIGALLTINKDNDTKTYLLQVKDTLSEAMNTIRESVHNLHERAIDLHTEIEKIVSSFSFCPINLNYDISPTIDKNIKYCFIAVIKEALSNIVKHSDASRASIILREHPALYQLIISDNGTNCSYNFDNGIGLRNITERVTALAGNLNINADNGFRIFISIPKKEGKE